MCSHQPVAVTIGCRRYADHGLAGAGALAGRAIETGVTKRGHATVCSHHPVAVTIGCRRYADHGLAQVPAHVVEAGLLRRRIPDDGTV